MVNRKGSNVAEAIDRALDALPNGGDDGDPTVFVAATGVRLKLKRVSQMIVADAKRRLPEPRVPKWINPDKEREEENPNDPAYVEALYNYRYDTSMLALRVYLIMGTEPILPLPSGMVPAESTEWSDAIMAADDGVEIPESGPRRYFCWLKYYALPDDEVMQVMTKIIRLSGKTLEEDVRRAQESFRGNPTGDTTNGVVDTTQDTGGNHNGSGPGDGPGIRGEGSGRILTLPLDSMDQGDGRV